MEDFKELSKRIQSDMDELWATLLQSAPDDYFVDYEEGDYRLKPHDAYKILENQYNFIDRDLSNLLEMIKIYLKIYKKGE